VGPAEAHLLEAVFEEHEDTVDAAGYTCTFGQELCMVVVLSLCTGVVCTAVNPECCAHIEGTVRKNRAQLHSNRDPHPAKLALHVHQQVAG
jgi:hypothetical protein